MIMSVLTPIRNVAVAPLQGGGVSGSRMGVFKLRRSCVMESPDGSVEAEACEGCPRMESPPADCERRR